MTTMYVLDDAGNPVAEPDILAWGRWLEKTERHVGKDTIGDVKISTVFLGIDHAFGGSAPVLFETMIFGGRHDGYQIRYETREEALAGHVAAIALVSATSTTMPATRSE
jgi:hypothetical protein